MNEPEYGLTEKERRATWAFKKHALEVALIGGSALAVYRVFLDKMNWRYRTSWCSRKELCKQAKISPRTLDDALKYLRKTGHIEAIAYAQGGRGMSPVYRFARAEMMKSPAKTPAKTYAEENNPEGKTYAETTAKSSEETAYPTSSEYKDTPSRRDVDKVPYPRTAEEHQLFSQLGRGRNYAETLEVWRAHITKQTEAAE